MSISREDVRHIALLARLELSDEEVDRYAEQLASILDYAETLNQLNTTGVEPLFHAVPLENVFREDHIGTPLPVSKALQNAARRRDVFFEVPKVADGS